jgi:hypothetical protein
MGEKQQPKIQVIDRSAPRVAIEITELVYDAKKKSSKRHARQHITVYGVSSEDARRIIAEAFAREAR